jgi:IclR family acetate operon transcriptional repressor
MRDSTVIVPEDVKPRVQSVARAIRILNEISASADGVTAQDLSRSAGLNRATTYHLLHTLVSTGYVVPADGYRYRIGIGAAALVGAFERQALPGGLQPVARAVASRTGETAYVAARQGDALILLCSVPGHHAVGVANSPMGPVQDGHARASGKLLLALAPEDVREAYLAAHPLRRITRNTITSRARLLDEFERIRETGYAIDEEEFNDGVCCIAAPLDTGTPIAVALSAPRERFDANREEYIATIVGAAHETVHT